MIAPQCQNPLLRKTGTTVPHPAVPRDLSHQDSGPPWVLRHWERGGSCCYEGGFALVGEQIAGVVLEYIVEPIIVLPLLPDAFSTTRDRGLGTHKDLAVSSMDGSLNGPREGSRFSFMLDSVL